MKMPLLACALALGCNCNDIRLVEHSPCGEPCYTGPAGTDGKGVCRSGWLACDDDGGQTCLDQTLPGEAICGQDNNCDGQPDKFGVTETCYDGDAGTLGKGICHSGYRTCQRSGWGACLGEQLPLTENCSGEDVNCDGVVNNIPPNPCYDGGLDTLSYPGCHYGHEACRGRQIACVDEATFHPVAGSYDIVFVITTDGYMKVYQQQLADILSSWCTTNTEARCAIVIAPDSDIDQGGLDGGFLFPYQLSPLNTSSFLNAIGNVQYQPNFWAGDVSINEAIFYSCDVTNSNLANPLALGWGNSGTRAVVYFTDEEAQWVLAAPSIGISSMCASNHVSVYGFSAGREFGSDAYSFFTDTIFILDDTLSNHLDQLFPYGACY